MILVPANMPRFGFSPCKKKKICFWFLQNFLFLKMEGLFSETKTFAGTYLKNKIFCRDQKLQNGSSHHVIHMQIITKMGSETILKNKKFCITKIKFFFLQGRKLKRTIFAGTGAIFKPNYKIQKRKRKIKIY